MFSEKTLKELGLAQGASKEEVLQRLFERADDPEEKAEIGDMLRYLRETRVDDSLEIVVNKFPLKIILKLLLLKHGSEEVRAALEDIDRPK